MQIHYLLNHVFGMGGTIATTIANANELAERGHSVEIASVVRRRESGRYPISGKVSVVFLTDRRKGFPDFRHPRSREASHLAPADERRHSVYSRLTDDRIASYLGKVDGVVIGTRPALNIAVARLADSAVRIGQEHIFLEHHRAVGRAETLDEMERWYPKLDAVVSLTSQDAANYRAMLPGTRVAVIPNACNTARLGLRTSTENKIVIAAGRLTGPKGFSRLIAAYSRVARDFPEWRLVIYGAGEGKDRLERQIKTAGATGKIILGGFTESLPERMSECGLLAMTSEFEGFPMVMLEALGIGVPLITFDFGSGARDLVSDGGNGRVVPAGDIKALSSALAELMGDAALRRAMGAKSLELAQEFLPEVIASRWEDLFLGITANRPVGASTLLK